MRKYVFTGWLVLICCSTRSVDAPYPGGSQPYDTATLFAPGIISTNELEHSSPAISPDGKTILWSVVSLPSWRSRIMEINFENAQWSTPRIASFNDTSASQIYPFFCENNEVLFSSDRPLPFGTRNSRGNVLWKVKYTATGWTDLHPLDSIVSGGGDYALSRASNGNLYFAHGPFRSPDWNIYLSDHNGDSRALMDSEINSPYYEDGVFIAPDESYLIFESDRPGGMGESIDLYISFKQKDGSWSSPVNMGNSINTTAAERFASVSHDGKVLFFGSNRRTVNGNPNFDIYWINATVIDMLRAKNNVSLK